MRKETSKIVNAFMAGQPATAARTMTDGKAVWLHGNKIFWRDKEKPDVYHFSMCGWATVTTRERLNGLLGAVYDLKQSKHPRDNAYFKNRWCLYQRKGMQLLNGPQGEILINSNETYTIA